VRVEEQRFKVSRSPDEVVVHLVFEGELDAASAPVLLEYLQDAVSPGFREDVCLDVSRMSFIDSCGLSLLVMMQKRAVANGRKFTLSSASGQFLKLLDMTGLKGFFDFTPS
jgi:anti-anti-sigma factor